MGDVERGRVGKPEDQMDDPVPVLASSSLTVNERAEKAKQRRKGLVKGMSPGTPILMELAKRMQWTTRCDMGNGIRRMPPNKVPTRVAAMATRPVKILAGFCIAVADIAEWRGMCDGPLRERRVLIVAALSRWRYSCARYWRGSWQTSMLGWALGRRVQ